MHVGYRLVLNQSMKPYKLLQHLIIVRGGDNPRRLGEKKKGDIRGSDLSSMRKANGSQHVRQEKHDAYASPKTPDEAFIMGRKKQLHADWAGI